VHESEGAFKNDIFAAGQGAALGPNQHIVEIQFYIVVNSHEIPVKSI
jgi:hypothetical protein